MEKQLLFSVTKNDFVIQTFCTGGNGGQHRNAKQNGVRIIHPPSGARAEHRDGRDQVINKRLAFEKLAKSKEFQFWIKSEVMRRLGTLDDVNAKVDDMMAEKNLKFEYF